MRNQEAGFIDWVTRQGPFVRKHGRFPYSWRTLSWAFIGIAAIAFYIVLEVVFHEEGQPWRPNPVVAIFAISLILQVVQRFLRTRLQKVVTGMAAQQTADAVEAMLRNLGYGPMWAQGKDVGIMRLETSTGFGKERHILVLVPDDGLLWITALKADAPFGQLTASKSFPRLLEKLRADFNSTSAYPFSSSRTA